MATEVRHRFNLGHGRIDPFKVAGHLNLEVVRYPIADGSIEGIYRPLPDGGGAILVNSASQNLRQRFTVAHEIGHALLHGRQVFVDDELNGKSAKTNEREADRFAGALLVDRDAAEEIAGRHGANVDAAVAEVVDTFGVNVATAAIQLKQYGFVDGKACDDFLARYENMALWEFMEAHGRRSPHRNGERQLSVDRRFKRRVKHAVESGQLTTERAAEFIGVSPAELKRLGIREPEPDEDVLVFRPDET